VNEVEAMRNGNWSRKAFDFPKINSGELGK
jgi:hypothetical protein